MPLSANWQVFHGDAECRVLVRDSLLLAPYDDPGLRLLTVDDVCDYSLGD